MNTKPFLLLAIACILITIDRIQVYVQNSSRRWFADEFDELIHSIETEEDKDNTLYKLSKWGEFTKEQFKMFVLLQIRALQLNQNASFFFLEVGMGVGAFSRRICQLFPRAHGIGFDIEPKAIQVAAHVLPSTRMIVSTGDMVTYMQQFPDNYFDVVFVPGSLCYLHSVADVYTVLHDISRILKTGGGVCLSMIASGNSPMGSCTTRIPKYIFRDKYLNMHLMSLDEMDLWNLPHASGRYSVCLRKTA